ncbi:PucR family transcriptional regulator ligand-binding domain-containing protein [Lactiplantibacillus plantarum]|uniref:PucR family transcriptional regulator ligand-binding domain-containing protein n=1 Tax=Lactiplantibacillus plantarum TaxID=1590 RepID=UPI0004834573|nr:PucR family transcriptional regulator ligand-binding domain-containing protein [Lactiplantibacillus plantarum]
MSVTTHEILKLPALKGAKVIAGAAALDKIVGSVSVLEYSQPTMVQNEILQHINFNHDEIVLTAFASIKNDITAQCRNIELLATAGEIGIILFYVGLIVPTIDPRVIATAEQHDFLLLCMPKNEPNITYSSVITENYVRCF